MAEAPAVGVAIRLSPSGPPIGNEVAIPGDGWPLRRSDNQTLIANDVPILNAGSPMKLNPNTPADPDVVAQLANPQAVHQYWARGGCAVLNTDSSDAILHVEQQIQVSYQDTLGVWGAWATVVSTSHQVYVPPPDGVRWCEVYARMEVGSASKWSVPAAAQAMRIRVVMFDENESGARYYYRSEGTDGSANLELWECLHVPTP